ncbi:hypothetical protein ACQ1XN_10840 [Staphylococcus cohnii]|uniref:hypothetical protein n=1 Tax=Staphylococcus cohnii TaxID=29382 RepID=UPI003D7D47F5
MSLKTHVLNENMNDEDFIQIIPAPTNLFATFNDEYGEYYSQIVCMALKNDGGIVFCDTDSTGIIEEIPITQIKKYNPETGGYKSI